MGNKSTSISEWFAITSQEGKTGFFNFYKQMLGKPVSEPERFFKAIDNFGHTIMFEAIVAASTRNLEGDPLNYVVAIAVAKVNERIEAIGAAERYAMNIQKAKQRTELQNEELDDKIQKALGEPNVQLN